MGQSAFREHGIFETGESHEQGNAECEGRIVPKANRSPESISLEAELQKLFLARLDVHSRIEEIQRTRNQQRSKKVDMESKLARLQEFHAKLLRREEELTRRLAQG